MSGIFPGDDGPTQVGPSENVYNDVYQERLRQDVKWGQQNWPDGTGGEGTIMTANHYRDITNRHAKEGTLTFWDILLEEVFEAGAETEKSMLSEELNQVAAVCLAWREKIQRGY